MIPFGTEIISHVAGRDEETPKQPDAGVAALKHPSQNQIFQVQVCPPKINVHTAFSLETESHAQPVLNLFLFLVVSRLTYILEKLSAKQEWSKYSVYLYCGKAAS